MPMAPGRAASTKSLPGGVLANSVLWSIVCLFQLRSIKNFPLKFLGHVLGQLLNGLYKFRGVLPRDMARSSA